MRMVFSLVLVLGLALAGFAVYMARGILSQNAAALQDAQAKTKETVPVFIMNTAVKYGDVLKKEDVATISWPKAAVPETAFTDIAKLFPADGEQRIVTRDIGKFEPILTSNVTEPGGDAGITSRLAPGMRAFAVKVDVTSGVSGFLKPGDRVDVYWTGTNAQDHSDVTRLIEPGVSVVAVDQTSNADQAAKAIIARTITVQATPQQVAVLAQGQATGKLALSLVGAQDDSVASAVEVDSNRLLGIQQQAPVQAPPKPKVCTIKQRSGSDVVEVPIPCTD